MMPAIEVNNLHKVFRIPHEKRNTVFETLTGFFRPSGYETFHALRDINFTVDKGEAMGIIGENGSGKSTLLKTIAHILRPTDGFVRINGRITPFLELGVGFQQDFTAAENIRTYATIMGLSKKEIESRLDDIIRFADLEKFRDTKLKNFSSGMQVRLAFSTAIQTNPEILLMDEVLAVGDMDFQQKCIDVLNQYRDEGVTIVFVSHDLGSVRRFCDRTMLLHKGEQVSLGSTQEVIDSYMYSRNEGDDPISDNPGSLENADSSKRWGNRRIEITDVELYDKFGNRSVRFNSFDPMDIRISYNARDKVKDPVFGIQLYSEKGEHLFGTNTEIKDTIIDHVEGEGRINLKVERIPMLTGRFLLTVAVHTRQGKIFDWHDKLYHFDVYPTCRDSGLFHVPCTWGL